MDYRCRHGKLTCACVRGLSGRRLGEGAGEGGGRRSRSKLLTILHATNIEACTKVQSLSQEKK